MNRLQEIQNRLQEIRTQLDSGSDDVNLDELEKEVRALQDERKEITRRADILKNADFIPFAPAAPARAVDPSDVRASQEYRSAFFKRLQGRELTDIEKRAYDSGAGSAGAVIPTQTAQMIEDFMIKTAPLLGEINLMHVPGNLRIGIENVRDNAAAHVENAPVVPANDSLAFITLAGFEFIKVIEISATVKAMAIPAFEQWIVKILGEDIAEQLERAIILGAPQGVTGGINDSNIWADGVNGVQYVGAPTYSELVELIGLLPARYDSRAKWLINKNTLYNTIAAVVDANGRPIIVTDVIGGLQQRLMGFPIMVSDIVPNGEAFFGDFTKIVGNMSQDITIDYSDQSGFLTNSVHYRGTCVFDCDCSAPAAIRKLFV